MIPAPLPHRLHGTVAAEVAHRRNDAWPCSACAAVRSDIAAQLHARYRASTTPAPVQAALASLERWWWWSEGERLDVCREAARTVRSVEAFAQVVGLAPPLAGELLRWLTVPPTLVGESAESA